MPKVRKRKSTNIGFDGDFANLMSGTTLQTRRFKLQVSGASGGSFTIDKTVDGGTTSSGPIVNDANRGTVKTAIGSIMEDVENAGGNAESGPLGTKPVGFFGNVEVGAEVTLTDALSPVGAVVEINERIVAGNWEWSNADIWRDIGTGRGLMQVGAKMKFTARRSGKWHLSYTVQNFTRRHRWVHKLDALDRQGEHLFTLVTPATACTPADRVHNVVLKGRSQEVITYLDEIGSFVRRGAGQYRV